MLRGPGSGCCVVVARDLRRSRSRGRTAAARRAPPRAARRRRCRSTRRSRRRARPSAPSSGSRTPRSRASAATRPSPASPRCRSHAAPSAVRSGRRCCRPRRRHPRRRCVSPSFTSPITVRPTHAVSPGMPSTPSAVDGGASSGRASAGGRRARLPARTSRASTAPSRLRAKPVVPRCDDAPDRTAVDHVADCVRADVGADARHAAAHVRIDRDEDVPDPRRRRRRAPAAAPRARRSRTRAAAPSGRRGEHDLAAHAAAAAAPGMKPSSARRSRASSSERSSGGTTRPTGRARRRRASCPCPRTASASACRPSQSAAFVAGLDGADASASSSSFSVGDEVVVDPELAFAEQADDHAGASVVSGPLLLRAASGPRPGRSPPSSSRARRRPGWTARSASAGGRCRRCRSR